MSDQSFFSRACKTDDYVVASDMDRKEEEDEEDETAGANYFASSGAAGSIHPLSNLLGDATERGIIGLGISIPGAKSHPDNQLLDKSSYSDSFIADLAKGKTPVLPFPYWVPELSHNFTLSALFQFPQGVSISQLADELRHGKSGNTHKPIVLSYSGASLTEKLEGIFDKNAPYQLLPLNIDIASFNTNIPGGFFANFRTKAQEDKPRLWARQSCLSDYHSEQTGVYIPENASVSDKKSSRIPLYQANLRKLGNEQFLRWLAHDSTQMETDLMRNSTRHPTHYSIPTPPDGTQDVTTPAYLLLNNAGTLYKTGTEDGVPRPYDLLGETELGSPLNIPTENLTRLIEQHRAFRNAPFYQMNTTKGWELLLTPSGHSGWDGIIADKAQEIQAFNGISNVAYTVDPMVQIAVEIQVCAVPVWKEHKQNARKMTGLM